MIPLRILADAEGMLEGVDRSKLIDGSNAALTFARLKHGTTSGNDTLSITIEFKDGRVVFAQTTMKLFLTAADYFRAAQNN